jgi:hypothetical protein
VPRISYVEKHNFRKSSLIVIQQANKIIDEYAAQGFNLTLRQLYYQFVSRDWIPNTQRSYKNLGGIVNDGRLAGMIDWSAITDRTRELQSVAHWESPRDIVEQDARVFRLDKWEDQDNRVEVWIEKEALIGVFEKVCRQEDVGLFACRGYTSQSEMWVAGQRLLEYREAGQTPHILHFGDHDPSGQDMTRDIIDRLELFMGGEIEVDRLALNMDQVRQYRPPPNPAKTTDSRYAGYIHKYGTKSWELDALEPRVLEALALKEIRALRNNKRWNAKVHEENDRRAQLTETSQRWDEVTEFLEE